MMNIKLGDYVEITAGPFSSQQGVVQEVYGNEPNSYVRVWTDAGSAVLVHRSLLNAVAATIDFNYDDTLWGY